jgi:hypothetical protein
MVYTLLGIDINNHFTFLGSFYVRKDAEKYSKELNYHKYALFYSSENTKKVEIDQNDDIISMETRRHDAFKAQQQEHKLKKEDNDLTQKEKSDKEFNNFLNSKTFSELSQKEQEQIKTNRLDTILDRGFKSSIQYNASLDPDGDKIRKEQGEIHQKKMLKMKLELGEDAYSDYREAEYHKSVHKYCEDKRAKEKADKVYKTAAVALQWIKK